MSEHRLRLETLEGDLEIARGEAIRALGEISPPYSSASLSELATLQSALTAVREARAAQGGRLGWGSSGVAPPEALSGRRRGGR
jgi:hypothetical protein